MNFHVQRISLSRSTLLSFRALYSSSSKFDGSTTQPIVQYPFWLPVSFFERNMAWLWKHVNYYYSQMYLEHHLKIQAELKERLSSQQRDLNAIVGLIKYSKEQQERLVRQELQESKDLSLAPATATRDPNAFVLLAMENKHTKQNIAKVEMDIKEYEARKEEISKRHQRENAEFEQFLTAGLPQAQLWMLLQSIYPSYYLFFFLLGIVVWVINLIRGSMVKRSIKKKLTLLQENFGRQFTPLAEETKQISTELGLIKEDLKAIAVSRQFRKEQQQQQEMEQQQQQQRRQQQRALCEKKTFFLSLTPLTTPAWWVALSPKRAADVGVLEFSRRMVQTMVGEVGERLPTSQEVWEAGRSLAQDPKRAAWAQFSASLVVVFLLLLLRGRF